MRVSDCKPYHVVSRAIAQEHVFSREEDRARFVVQMYAANIGKPALNIYRANIPKLANDLLEGNPFPERYIVKEHPPLVQFFSFVLVGDHYHFGLRSLAGDGVSKYMQKLNIGFAKYFNLRHKRRGTLFESRFKAFPIRHPRQLHEVIRYINVASVLEVYQPGWKKEGLENTQQALMFLHDYSYSSFQDLFRGRSSYIISQATKNTLQQLLGVNFFQRPNVYLRSFEKEISSKKLVRARLFLE